MGKQSLFWVKKQVIPPLITFEAIIENIKVNALYDPGCNASAMTWATFNKIKDGIFLPDANKGLNTIDGEVIIIGTALVEIKIFNITCRVAVFIVDPKSCKHDFILGLDLIPKFKLNLNYELNLTQLNCENNIKELSKFSPDKNNNK